MPYLGGPPRPTHTQHGPMPARHPVARSAYHAFDPGYLAAANMFTQYPQAFHPSTMYEDIVWEQPYALGQGYPAPPPPQMQATPLPPDPMQSNFLAALERGAYTQMQNDMLMPEQQRDQEQEKQSPTGEQGGEQMMATNEQNNEIIQSLLMIENARANRLQEHMQLLQMLVQSSEFMPR